VPPYWWRFSRLSSDAAANGLRASKASFRRNSNPTTRKLFVPDRIVALMTAPAA
jgi:hypothetical protein